MATYKLINKNTILTEIYLQFKMVTRSINKLMKLKTLLSVFFACGVPLLNAQKATAQETWPAKQMVQPKELAEKINNHKLENIVVFNVGPAGRIKGSVYIGSTSEDESLKLLKSKLNKLPKNTEVVIYCGCCPFKHCPNIKPALKLLNKMQFTNAKVLNLSKNLKADWIDEGYPMQD